MTTTKTRKLTAPRATEPVGLHEIAERLDVSRFTVDKWQQRELLPEPTWSVGNRPAWNWPVIWKWARDTGRLPEQRED